MNGLGFAVHASFQGRVAGQNRRRHRPKGGQAARCRQGAREEPLGPSDQLGISDFRHDRREPCHCTGVAVFRSARVEPVAVRCAEVPKAAALGQEGFFEKAHRPVGAPSDRRPAELAGVQNVHDQGPRDVVGAVAEGRIRHASDRMLPDADAVAHGIEVRPAHGREVRVSHGRKSACGRGLWAPRPDRRLGRRSADNGRLPAARSSTDCTRRHGLQASPARSGRAVVR